MSEPATPPGLRRGTILAAALLLLATIAAFSPIFANAFLTWDDAETIAKNPVLRLPWLDAVLWYVQHSHMHLYAPTTYAVWRTLAAIAWRPDGSLATWPFHAANFAMHLGVVALAFVLARRAKLPPAPTLLMATLVALHPIQVEAVAWISGFKDVAGAFLIYAAALLWTRDDRPRTRVAATVLYLLALTTKPTAIAAPFVVLALDWLECRPLKPAAKSLAPWFVLAICFALIGASVQPAPHDESVAIAKRPLLVLDSIGWYASAFAWPTGLTIDHGRTPTRVLDGFVDRVGPTLGLVGFAIVAAVALIRRSSRRRAVVAIALAGLAIAPVCGLVPFDFQAISGVAEHYFYLAMPGAALLVATLLAGRPRLAAMVALVAALAGGALTFRQAKVWWDDASLYAQVERVNPESWIAANARSVRALEAGDTIEAERAARRTVDLNERYPNGYVNLALAQTRRGQRELAIATMEKAFGLAPTNAIVNLTLGTLRAEAGQTERAMPKLENAVALDPTNPVAHANYANALLEAGRLDEAIAQYGASLRLADDPLVRTHRAMALAAAGRLAAARADVAAALAQKPDLAEAIGLQEQLGR